jgi:hypothetical protein
MKVLNLYNLKFRPDISKFTIKTRIWKKIYVYTSSIKSNIVDEIYENFKI